MSSNQKFKTKAVDIIAHRLAEDHGWAVGDDVAANGGEYLNVWLPPPQASGYLEVSVLADQFDAEGNGTCVMHLVYGDGDDESFDIELVMRSWEPMNLEEFHEGLVLAFDGKSPRRGKPSRLT